MAASLSGFGGRAQRLPIWMGAATTGAGGRADDYPCGLNKGSKGHYGQPRLIDHVRKEITAQSADEGNGGGDRRLRRSPRADCHLFSRVKIFKAFRIYHGNPLIIMAGQRNL